MGAYIFVATYTEDCNQFYTLDKEIDQLDAWEHRLVARLEAYPNTYLLMQSLF